MLQSEVHASQPAKLLYFVPWPSAQHKSTGKSIFGGYPLLFESLP